MIYWIAFTENINNNRKVFFSETSQPGTYIIRVEKFYRTYSPPPCCDRIFCRNSCEMWSETRWRYVNIYKGIQIKRNCQDIYYAHFPKPGILFRSFECLKSEEWNLLKTGLSKGNAYYPAFSCFTRWNCLGIFFFIQTHILLLSCRFCSSWTPPQYLFILHKF